MSTQNVEIVRESLDAFQRGDVDRALAVTDHDLVSTRHDPDGAVFHGRDGFRALLADWIEGWSDWSFHGDEYVDLGDEVVVRMRQWGRGAGSGAPVEGVFWLVFGFAGGRVARLDIYNDQAEALRTGGRPQLRSAQPE
jgi:ketosteroid isomerase-like protein